MKVTAEMKLELISQIEKYLSGESSHKDISEYAWRLTDLNPVEPPEEDELFWSGVFSIIHLADDGHWQDGVTQRSLGNLCNELKKQ